MREKPQSAPQMAMTITVFIYSFKINCPPSDFSSAEPCLPYNRRSYVFLHSEEAYYHLCSNDRGHSRLSFRLSVSSLLQTDASFGHTYLSQAEAVNRAIIHVEENGIPLIYSGSWKPKTDRAQLIDMAKERAQAEGVTFSKAPVSSYMEQTPIFKIEGTSGDSYYAKAFVTATENGSKSLFLLTRIVPRKELIRHSLPFFLMVSALGVIMILIVRTDRFYLLRISRAEVSSGSHTLQYLSFIG